MLCRLNRKNRAAQGVSGNKFELPEADFLAPTDNQVIVHDEIDRLRGLNDLLRHGDISSGGCRIA